MSLSNLMDPSVIRNAMMGTIPVAIANFVLTWVVPSALDYLNVSDSELGVISNAAADNPTGSSIYVALVAFIARMAASVVGINF